MTRAALRWLGMFLLAGSVVMVILPALGYLTAPVGEYGFSEQAAAYRQRPGWLRMHVVGSVVALACGTLQLLLLQRTAPAAVHRWLGRTYAAAVLAAGAAGLALAPSAWGGPSTSLGFGLLAVTWLAATVLGIDAAWKQDRSRHRAWMLRSYALCLAGVTLRVELPALLLAGVDFAAAYATVAWSCWVPNLVVVEAWIRCTPLHRS